MAPLDPRVVGELACQRDSYLKSLQTVVVSCVPVPAAKSDSKRTKKNKADNGKGSSTPVEGTVEDGAQMWEVEFEDTVLFPEGGGQPTDHGTLFPASDTSKRIPITTIHRHGLRAVHFSPTPLAVGETVTQEVDFTRRWDHMQQHTGQHLLSAIMDTYGDLETLGWGMGSDGGMNYVELGRKPTEAEIADIQRRCNEIVARNVGITVNTPLDAKTDSLPADYDKEKGIVRVIKIGDIDENSCCGTHLSQTSHISLILLHHTQPIRGTNTRLFFTCGNRAIQLATAATQAIRSISGILSHGSTPAEVVEKVEKVSIGYRDSHRRARKLEAELARYESERVARDLASTGRSWVYRSDAGMDFITAVTQGLTVNEGIVVLAAGEGAEGGPVVILGNEKSVEEMVGKVKEAVKNVKGGGKGGRWQGKAAAWGKGELDALRQLVENANAS